MSRSRPWLEKTEIDALQKWHTPSKDINLNFLFYKACGGENPDTSTSSRKGDVEKVKVAYDNLLSLAAISDEQEREAKAKELKNAVATYKKMVNALFKIVKSSKQVEKQLTDDESQEFTKQKEYYIALLEQCLKAPDSKAKASDRKIKNVASSSALADKIESSTQSPAVVPSTEPSRSRSSSRNSASSSRHVAAANESEFPEQKMDSPRINSLLVETDPMSMSMPGGLQGEFFGDYSPSASRGYSTFGPPVFGKAFSVGSGVQSGVPGFDPDYNAPEFPENFDEDGFHEDKRTVVDVEEKYSQQHQATDEPPAAQENNMGYASGSDSLDEQIKIMQKVQEEQAQTLMALSSMQKKQVQEIRAMRVANEEQTNVLGQCLSDILEEQRRHKDLMKELVYKLITEQKEPMDLPPESPRSVIGAGILINAGNLPRSDSAATSARESVSSNQSVAPEEEKSVKAKPAELLAKPEQNRFKKAVAVLAAVASSLVIAAILIQMYASGLLAQIASSIATIGLGGMAPLPIVIPVVMGLAFFMGVGYLIFGNKPKIKESTPVRELSPVRTPRHNGSSHDMLKGLSLQPSVDVGQRYQQAQRDEKYDSDDDEKDVVDYGNQQDHFSPVASSLSLKPQQEYKQRVASRLQAIVSGDRHLNGEEKRSHHYKS